MTTKISPLNEAMHKSVWEFDMNQPQTPAQQRTSELKKSKRAQYRQIILSVFAADPQRWWRMGELKDEVNKDHSEIGYADTQACLRWLVQSGAVCQKRGKKSHVYQLSA